MMKRHILAIIIVTLYITLQSLSGSSSPVHASPVALDYLLPLDSLNMTRIEDYMRMFSSYGTRATGYLGYENAAAFIFETLMKLGLNPKYEYYNVTVPIDYGAALDVYGEDGSLIDSFEVYPLRPNLIETCTTSKGGIYGRLFYVGRGTLSDFREKEIEGSLVIMDFNSRSNWINAAKFGAKAVIFLEPEECSRTEALQKYLNIPLDFPRVFLPRSRVSDLLYLVDQRTAYGKLQMKMEFENVKAKNILCYINGTDPQLSSDVIVLSAYFDSCSIVPSLSPGAEESIGASVLLELANFLSENPPKRTVLLLALSGHHQGLAGIRAFVDKHFPDLVSDEIGTHWKYRLLVNLDLSSENNVVGVFYWGYFYVFQKISGRFESLNAIFSDYLPGVRRQTGRNLQVENCLLVSLLPETMYTKYMFDSEPFTLAGGVGVTFATTQTLRYHQETPHDDMSHIDFSNIKPQVEGIICVLYALLNDETLNLPSILPTRYDAREGGFATIEGQVLEYDYSTGWFVPVPNALVYIQGYPVEPYVVGEDLYGNYLPLCGHEFVVRADSQGNFTVRGVAPRSVYVNPLGDFNYIFEAYVDKPSAGSVDYAPDLGKYSTFPKRVLVLRETEKIYPVVFKCGTAALYDVLNPSSLQPLEGVRLEINDFRTHFAFDHFGYTTRTYTTIPSPVRMLFVPPENVFEVVIKSAVRVFPAGFIINASRNNPQGSGLEVEQGNCLHITPIQIANDIYWLNYERTELLQSYGLASLLNETKQLLSYKKLADALRTLSEHKYDQSYDCAFAVWANEFHSYAEIRTLIQDSSNTIVFFTIMLIPFSILLEGLLFEHKNPFKRSLTIGAIIITFLIILSTSHPGFKVSPNAPLVLMGFAITSLISPALVILFWKSWDYAKEFRTRYLGKHFTEISTASALLLAFSMGISNMRRRKLRTVLALLSLVLITFALVSLSSFPEIIVPATTEFERKTEYNGLLIREPRYSPINDETISILNETISGSNGLLAPRSFLGGRWSLVSERGETYTIQGILGLHPNEPANVQQTINGTWFSSLDKYSCIIPSGAARNLSVSVGDYLKLSGIYLHVSGIFNEQKIDNITDLDQNPIIPSTGSGGAGGVGGAFLESRFIIIVPYQVAVRLGGQSYALPARFENASDIHTAFNLLSKRFLQLSVYCGVNNKVSVITRTRQISLGIEMLAVPFAIVLISIFNLMLGTIHERIKEISIYSSIGLSPLHIVGMFLSEAVLYSALSSVFGYVMGVLGIKLTQTVGIDVGITPNYSSSMVINAVVLTMLAILASTAYPFYKASRMVTPSLERRWKMPSKPKGNEWHIPLPFVIEESIKRGLLMYMKEYLASFPTERAALFSVSDLKYRKENGEESLEFTARLSPYEAGIRQRVSLKIVFQESDKKYHVHIFIQRLAGILSVWRTANRPFVNDLRRQLLNWQSLTPEEKERYQKRME